MTIKTPGDCPDTGAQDPTTPAVFDVIRTMDNKGGILEEAPHGVPTTDEPNITSSADQPHERLNADLEERLISIDVFGRRSMAQRRVLGCLGCKLATQPGNTGAVRSLDIAQCNNSANAGVRRILRRLVNGGFLKTEKREAPAWGKKPPDYFRFTARAVEFAFKRKLEVPAQCGLESEGGSRRFNDEAEAMLVEAGVFEARGNAPRAILGCLACQQQIGKGVHVKGVQRCAGIPHSHTLAVLRRMVEGGVLQAEEEPIHPGGRRVAYTPADTELARNVTSKLEMPLQCGLEDKA